MLILKDLWGYDIETYPDIFTCAVENIETGETLFFEISDQYNDLNLFCEFIYKLSAENQKMVGYNNIGFDYPIIHRIVNDRINNSYDIFLICDQIINGGDRFSHLIWDNDRIVYQIDLYKIHHFDNVSRSTSLKTLEFNMRSQNIEDLPFTPAVVVGRDNYPVLRKYNKHDVSETIKFFHHTKKMIEMRIKLSKKYKIDFINHNDTKIGKDYFINKLGKHLCYYKDFNGKRQPRQTVRNHIALNDVIFQNIDFVTPQFKNILTYFKSQIINETKGVFSDVSISKEIAFNSDPASVKVSNIPQILIRSILDQPNDPDALIKVKKSVKSAISAGKPVKLVNIIKTMINPPFELFKYKSSSLNCTINGFNYVFGVGGIHGSIDSAVVESDQDYMILDIDVASYYPNIAIANKLYPLHLGDQFCSVYEDVYKQRKATYKGSPENAMLKLALNGVYGDSNNVYSPFYDPSYTMAITINGQLLLCLLSETMIHHDVKMIQINTDGLTIKIPRSFKNWIKSICRQWERRTGLTLEFAEYSRIFIRDVNNYIAESTDGKIKRKGCYACDRSNLAELPWHKNQSALIIPMAAEHALLTGGDIGDFVRSHDNYLDFMKRGKVPRLSRLVAVGADGLDVEQNKTIRYYLTTSVKGVNLIKIMPPLAKNPDKYRRIGIDAGLKVAICNNLDDVIMPIDFDYYIDQALKLVSPLIR